MKASWPQADSPAADALIHFSMACEIYVMMKYLSALPNISRPRSPPLWYGDYRLAICRANANIASFKIMMASITKIAKLALSQCEKSQRMDAYYADTPRAMSANYAAFMPLFLNRNVEEADSHTR